MPRTDSEVEHQKLKDLEKQLLSESQVSAGDDEEYDEEDGEDNDDGLVFEDGTVRVSSSNISGTIVTESQDVVSESQT